MFVSSEFFVAQLLQIFLHYITESVQGGVRFRIALLIIISVKEKYFAGSDLIVLICHCHAHADSA